MTPSHIHGFSPHPEFQDYEVCGSCGSMHRIKNVVHDDVYASAYWDRPGYSSMEEQVFNVDGHKNERGLTKCDVVMEYTKEGNAALEIACAPGSLIKRLREKYQHVIGIEYDSSYRDRIAKVVDGHGAVVYGAFPSVSEKWPGESYDFICGLDIFEHIDEGDAFMAEILRLLKPDGTVLMMCPMVSNKRGPRSEDVHEEHVWLRSESFLKEWFSEMFQTVKFDLWLRGHECIIGSVKKGVRK